MSQDALRGKSGALIPSHLHVILSKSFVKYEHSLPVSVNEMMFNYWNWKSPISIHVQIGVEKMNELKIVLGAFFKMYGPLITFCANTDYVFSFYIWLPAHQNN